MSAVNGMMRTTEAFQHSLIDVGGLSLLLPHR